jgi:hypothetical protein
LAKALAKLTLAKVLLQQQQQQQQQRIRMTMHVLVWARAGVRIYCFGA